MAVSVGSSYLHRLIGAAALDASTYEEVEADPRATRQALLTVVVSSAAAGLGSRGFGGDTVVRMAMFAGIALFAWTAWAMLPAITIAIVLGMAVGPSVS